VRLFAALELPAVVREGIAAAFSHTRTLAPGAKWVATAAMHLTLHFFGEVSEPSVPQLLPTFDNPSLQVPSIQAVLGKPGFFPGGGAPKVLWVGIAVGTEEMQRFWSRFTDALQGLRVDGGPLEGWSPDPRGFSPHITVARSGAVPLSRELADQVTVPPVEFQVEKCVLFQSILGPAGPKYIPLKIVQFAAGPA